MLRLMKPARLPLLIVLATLAVPGRASATPIAPGSTVVPAPSAETGALLALLLNVPYVLGSGASGVVTEAVYADPLNPFGAGDLSFVVQVLAATGDGDVDTVSLSSFGTLPLDVVQSQGPLAPAFPSSGIYLAGSADRLTSGAINFTISPPNGMPDTPGSTTWLFIVRTPATNFIAGNITVGGDNVDGTPEFNTVAGLAPVVPAAVPEPATLTLLGTGLLAVARRRLRARRG